MAQTERQKFTRICMRNQSAPVGAIRGKSHSMMKSSADYADRAEARARSKKATATWRRTLRNHSITQENGYWFVRSRNGELLARCINLDTALSAVTAL